jgi:hypothetical protein
MFFLILISVVTASIDPIVISLIELDTLESFCMGSRMRVKSNTNDSTAKTRFDEDLSNYLNGIRSLVDRLDERGIDLNEQLSSIGSGNGNTYIMYKSRYQIIKDTIALASINIKRGIFDVNIDVNKSDLIGEDDVSDILTAAFDLGVSPELFRQKLFSDLMILGGKAKNTRIDVLQLVEETLSKLWAAIRNKNEPRPEVLNSIKIELRINKIRKDRVLNRLESLMKTLANDKLEGNI